MRKRVLVSPIAFTLFSIGATIVSRVSMETGLARRSVIPAALLAPACRYARAAGDRYEG